MSGIALPVAQLGTSICSGHPAGPTYFPPRPATTGSPTVFADGIPVLRMTDQWAPHTNILTVHSGVSIGGSATVFCEGLPLVRMTDAIDCGSIVLTGSATVFSG